MKELLLEFIEWAKNCGEDAFYIFENEEEAVKLFMEQRKKQDESFLINACISSIREGWEQHGEELDKLILLAKKMRETSD